MEGHLAVMRTKSMKALATISTAAEIAGVQWQDFARVIPQRVESMACYGFELCIIAPTARSRLNSMQRMWGASMLGIFPGDPDFNRVAGWKLLVEMGWQGRLWHRAVVKALMLEERAALAGWAPLSAVLGHSKEVSGSWLRTAGDLRRLYAIPAFDRAAARKAPSRSAARERLKKYRKECVEPRVFAEAEREVARERAAPSNALYGVLHPSWGPVAEAVENHEWGPCTLDDYRAWSRLRVMQHWRTACPVCGGEGPTAEHILGEHATPRLPLPAEDSGDGALWYLRTDLPPATLRRNI